MGIPGHVLTSATAVGIAFGLTRSTSLSLGVAVGSLLLDVDHFPDYLFIDDQQSLNPLRFLRYYGNHCPPRRVLLLHSYELLIALLALAFLTGSKALGGFAAGAFVHLVADILPRSNRSIGSRIKFYSLIYRWHYGFNSSRLYRQD